MSTPARLTAECTIHAPIAHVWNCWTLPEHMTNWNFASDDWHCPAASNDLRVGEKFVATMAAKDGSASFDFEGIYDLVEEHSRIEYHLADGRIIHVLFEQLQEGVCVTEHFDPEHENPLEMQQAGWQMILNNFKKYAEK